MDDDNWGLGEEPPAKPDAQTPNDIPLPNSAQETKTDKEEEKDNPNDQSESRIVENSTIQPDKKPEETNNRRGRRGQENIATVEEKVEELNPDKNNESLWGEESNNAEKEKQQQERNNERSGRGRGNRQSQEDNGGRGGRGYNRNYQGNREEDGNTRGRGNREENGNQRGRGNRGDERPPRQNGFNNAYRGGNRGYNGGDRDGQQGGRGNWENRGDRNDGQRGRGRGRGRGGYNNDRNFHNQNYQNDQQARAEQKAKKAEVLLPKGRKYWPQCSIYIFGAKLTITLRKASDFQCQLLVAPFFTPKLQLYPGNIINQSKLSYKQKIAKRQELKNAGQVYFQKAIGVGNFEGLAFLKVDDTKLEASFKKGIKKTFQTLESIEDIKFSSVVFCLSEQLGNPLPIIDEIILCLQKTENIKEFYLCTVSRKCFLDCIDVFKEKMQILFDENEVSTD